MLDQLEDLGVRSQVQDKIEIAARQVFGWCLGKVELHGLDAVRPGIFYSPKGTWFRSSPTGMTTNALIPTDIRTDIERGACYNETFVDIVAGTAASVGWPVTNSLNPENEP